MPKSLHQQGLHFMGAALAEVSLHPIQGGRVLPCSTSPAASCRLPWGTMVHQCSRLLPSLERLLVPYCAVPIHTALLSELGQTAKIEGRKGEPWLLLPGARWEFKGHILTSRGLHMPNGPPVGQPCYRPCHYMTEQNTDLEWMCRANLLKIFLYKQLCQIKL